MPRNFSVLLTLIVCFVNDSLSFEKLTSSVLHRYGAEGASSRSMRGPRQGCTVSPN